MGKNTLNASAMKAINQRKILHLLYSRPCSRADLAKQTGLSRAAITLIINELLEMGILEEGDPIQGKAGRTSFEIKIRKDLYYMLGINISRTGYGIGVFDFCCGLLHYSKGELAQTPQKTLEEIQMKITSLLKNHRYSGKLLGIGITAPGPLDAPNKKILNPPNFGLWEFINIGDYFREIYDCPVVLANNANALALAEKAFGAGKNLSDFVELNIDSGIGGGVIINNQLYRGQAGFGNDFGHMSIKYDGEPCYCGNIGCLEMYASVPGILKYARRMGSHYENWAEIADDAAAGSSAAMDIVGREAELLAVSLTNIVNILDVDTVILSGELAYHSDLLIRQLQILVNQRILSRVIKKVNIISTELTEHAELISSGNLVFDYFINNL